MPRAGIDEKIAEEKLRFDAFKNEHKRRDQEASHAHFHRRIESGIRFSCEDYLLKAQ